MQGQCPNCKGVFNVKPDWIGQQAQCPYCKQQMTIQPVLNAESAYSNNAGTGYAQMQNTTPAENVASLSGSDCFQRALKKYACFSGRASRKEYWYFILWAFIVECILAFICGVLQELTGIAQLADAVITLYGVGLVLPTLALGVRRMHDMNKSGWWIFISCLPLIGGIWMFVLLCTRGDRGPNRYGNDPYGETE